MWEDKYEDTYFEGGAGRSSLIDNDDSSDEIQY